MTPKNPGNEQCDADLGMNAYMPTHGVHREKLFTTVHRSPNPFRNRIAERLAQKGGKHRASCVTDGRLFQTEEVAVAARREAMALRD